VRIQGIVIKPMLIRSRKKNVAIAELMVQTVSTCPDESNITESRQNGNKNMARLI
jgi:hypothetical protein